MKLLSLPERQQAQELHNKYIASLSAIESGLVAAFDKNDVEYTVTDKGISFEYKIH